MLFISGPAAVNLAALWVAGLQDNSCFSAVMKGHTGGAYFDHIMSSPGCLMDEAGTEDQGANFNTNKLLD